MEPPPILTVIAEISIAFAGFSGLIIALRGGSGPLTEVEKFRLRVMLLLAFGALFLALLPELLFYAGIEPLWRLASLVFAAYSVVAVGWWIIVSMRMKNPHPEIFHWSAFSRMIGGHVIAFALQLGVVAGLIVDAAPATYLAGLIWYMVHAAQQFTRMLFVRLRDEP